jgi:hypothetical protein
MALKAINGKQPIMGGHGLFKDIGMTWFIITKSIVFITIKPCTCNGRSILPLMENVDNHTTLFMDLSQSKLIE